MRNTLIKLLGVSCINFNPTYPYKLNASKLKLIFKLINLKLKFTSFFSINFHQACELALNDKFQFIDPRSDFVKTRIPIVFFDKTMSYVNKSKPDRYTEILVENFNLLNYSPLSVSIFSFHFYRDKFQIIKSCQKKYAKNGIINNLVLK
jgi:hypothetical protein